MVNCNSKTSQRGKTACRVRGKLFPLALTIAGSDSGGGAGIQADLRTFSSLRVFGISAITALTAQNPFEVRSIYPVSAEFLRSQLETLFAKFAVSSAKTGMLFNSEIINELADFLLKIRRRPKLICDPVMVSSSGSLLLEKVAVKELKNKIFPLAHWVTPNLKEAELICGKKIKNIDDAISAARDISTEFKCGVVLKGGHLDCRDNLKTDVVACAEKSFYMLSSPKIDCDPVAAHGTGCTFSAAMAANFAKGMGEIDAITYAKAFVYSSLLEKVHLGKNINAMFPPLKIRIKDIKLCRI